MTAGGLLSVGVPAVGTALVQMLWQGALAAGLLWAVQPWLRRATARARYAAACAALFALPVGFAATVWLAVESGSGAIRWLPAIAPGQEAAWMPYLVAAWAAGAAGVGVYSAVGWGLAQRLRRRVSYAVPEAVQAQMEKLRAVLRASRRTRLGVSATAPGPCVLGWWRPLILLPAGALTGMAPEQLEALLAHELAHIRRHDYLVNLAQRAVEAAFFYHPAMWWISRQVTEEREHCCDDLAIGVCGDRVGYARALVDAAARATAAGLPATAPATALAASGGSLRRRVERILQGALPRQGGSRGAALASGAALAALALAGLLAGAPRMRARAHEQFRPAAPLAPMATTAAAVRMAQFAPLSAGSAKLPAARPAILRVPQRRPQLAPAPAPVRLPPVGQPAPRTQRLSEKIVLAWAPTGVQACRPQVVMQPMIAPDGRMWVGLRTVTRCQPVMRPVEVLVVTT